ncbi:acyl carrier protein [Streptomyces lasiicapitis]|uniref:Acyl carrier protein n=1 Tax=Streptomyces lasiicapitis TaxID=1923961 RepID=A0ABQ2MWT8_9ACTN|nr:MULTISPECIES: acyl carrier protein [Streptomyces]QIB42025.1 acyl carrier protein [Streptomyces aureoverticillatus]GGO60265.1 hypothetical protein GCM10012286_83730 [Streptomyces lasiicapitis]
MDRAAAVRKEIQNFMDQYYAREDGASEGADMFDIDSFTVVQLVLYLEDKFDIVILEELHGFVGGDFDAFATFVAATGQEHDAA